MGSDSAVGLFIFSAGDFCEKSPSPRSLAVEFRLEREEPFECEGFPDSFRAEEEKVMGSCGGDLEEFRRMAGNR